jgi:hypothetical protein
MMRSSIMLSAQMQAVRAVMEAVCKTSAALANAEFATTEVLSFSVEPLERHET